MDGGTLNDNNIPQMLHPRRGQIYRGVGGGDERWGGGGTEILLFMVPKRNEAAYYRTSNICTLKAVYQTQW